MQCHNFGTISNNLDLNCKANSFNAISAPRLINFWDLILSSSVEFKSPLDDDVDNEETLTAFLSSSLAFCKESMPSLLLFCWNSGVTVVSEQRNVQRFFTILSFGLTLTPL